MSEADKPPEGAEMESAGDEKREQLDLVLAQFVATMDGLDEVRAVVAPHVDELDAEHFSAEGLASLATVSDAGHEKLVRFFDRDSREAAESSEAAPAPSHESALAVSDRESRVGGDPRLFMDAFDNDPRLVLAWARRLLHVSLAPRTQILYGSMLTVAVSAFEALLAGVVAQRYRLHSGALGDEKEFSLSDLKQFENLRDAREALITRRVETLLRKSADDWSRWCERNVGVSIAGVAPNFETFQEALQRRHVIVHNAGRVSRQYLAKCKSGELPELGMLLPVSAEYLEVALDQILLTGVVIVFIAWLQWGPPQQVEGAESELLDFVYRCMKSDKWAAVEHLCLSLRPRVTSQSAQCVLTVNGWLARKRQGEDVSKDVEAWDVSALDERFTLAKTALLDDLDATFPVLRRMIQRDAIRYHDVVDWPLLEEVRADERIQEILELRGIGASPE